MFNKIFKEKITNGLRLSKTVEIFSNSSKFCLKQTQTISKKKKFD